MFQKAYKSLEFYKEAYTLVLFVYRVTESYPKNETFGLISQMRRAALSVVANFVEGWGRSGKKEKRQFYLISKASLEELCFYLDISKDIGYLSITNYKIACQKSEQTGRLLQGLIKSVR